MQPRIRASLFPLTTAAAAREAAKEEQIIKVGRIHPKRVFISMEPQQQQQPAIQISRSSGLPCCCCCFFSSLPIVASSSSSSSPLSAPGSASATATRRSPLLLPPVLVSVSRIEPRVGVGRDRIFVFGRGIRGGGVRFLANLGFDPRIGSIGRRGWIPPATRGPGRRWAVLPRRRRRCPRRGLGPVAPLDPAGGCLRSA
jgi:hypothetical protein